ncbi:MAG: flagellar M-ring protein FliF C-terminal domain-containing protein [Planctomycetota bacterium]
MATDFKQLSQAVKDSSPRTRMVAIGGVLLVVVAIAISSVLASRPHFVLLHAQVDDQARVAVEKALAGASIRYRISQPPGPFVIDVDEAQFYEAQNAVAVAGAMKGTSSGIETGSSGATSIFMTSAERAQTMQKREWQELENQLGCLDFVASAKVTTSVADNSPLRVRKPVTVSVTLALRGQTELSAEQAENVARIVRYRFDVPAENVVVTDQKGRTLFAGELEGGTNLAQTKDQGEYARSFERILEEKANAALSRAYGANKGYVTLATEWDFDLRTIDDDVVQPKGVLVDDQKTETITPPGAPSPEVGGPAGTASNIAQADSGAPPAAAPASQAPATTSEQKRKYETGRTKTRTVHSSPKLERMSVSLVLDESLAAKKDEITQVVEAIVGFEKSRQDVLHVSTTAIAVESTEPGVDAPVAVVSEGMSPTLKLILQHGIELMAAAVFLFIALRALRGARRGGQNASGPGTAVAAIGGSNAARRGLAPVGETEDVEPDPELIARMRVEELVRSDPRRVGEILSRWATESTKAAGSSR